MRTVNYLKIAILSIVLVLGFSSCEKNYYEDFQNSDDKLCNKTWVEHFVVSGNIPYVTHTLFFQVNGRGEQRFEHRVNEDDLLPQTTVTHNFTWRWTNNKESIVIDLGREKIFLDAVIARTSFLTGNYDGPLGAISSYYTGPITLRSDDAE